MTASNDAVRLKAERAAANPVLEHRAHAAQRKPRSAAARKRAATGTATVHEVMGELFDMRVSSEVDVLALQRRGLPADALGELMRHLPAHEMEVIVSRSSLRRRIAQGVLSEVESERALRVARVLARAIQVFGDKAQAQEWLARPAAYVAGDPAESPLQLCAYEAGAKIVEDQLLKAEYGVF